MKSKKSKSCSCKSKPKQVTKPKPSKVKSAWPKSPVLGNAKRGKTPLED